MWYKCQSVIIKCNLTLGIACVVAGRVGNGPDYIGDLDCVIFPCELSASIKKELEDLMLI